MNVIPYTNVFNTMAWTLAKFLVVFGIIVFAFMYVYKLLCQRLPKPIYDVGLRLVGAGGGFLAFYWCTVWFL